MVFLELYTVIPVIIRKSFHDVYCFNLANCVPQFCLDCVHVIKSLSHQSQLMFWTNKDYVANLVSTEGMEQQTFYFLARNSGRDKAE